MSRSRAARRDHGALTETWSHVADADHSCDLSALNPDSDGESAETLTCTVTERCQPWCDSVRVDESGIWHCGCPEK
jgi:hypothetical protein